jgi:hypothetical protein
MSADQDFNNCANDKRATTRWSERLRGLIELDQEILVLKSFLRRADGGFGSGC